MSAGEELARRAPAVSDAVIARMYEDPFWAERFGDRGRRHAGQDGGWHVSYLLQALASRDPALLVSYARWLRTVLVSRGMCTRHLAENLRLLAGALLDDGAPGADEAARYLATAAASLAWDVGPAAELEAALPAAERAAVDDIAARHPEWTAADRARCEVDVRAHLSYLADAVALARPELFAAHARWWAGFVARRTEARAAPGEVVAAAAATAERLSPDVRTRCRAALDAARAALEAP